MVFLLCLMIHSGTVLCSLLGVLKHDLYTTVILVQVSITGILWTEQLTQLTLTSHSSGGWEVLD